MSYSPEFNPIESVFGKVKSIFKRRKLQSISNKENFDQDLEIKMAFRKIKKADVVGYAKLSFAYMYKFDS